MSEPIYLLKRDGWYMRRGDDGGIAWGEREGATEFDDDIMASDFRDIAELTGAEVVPDEG